MHFADLVAFSILTALLAYEIAGGIVLRSSLRLQILTVSLLLLTWISPAIGMPPHYLALAPLAGLAVGAFRSHSMRTAFRVYRATAYVLLFMIVWIHPAMWGGTEYYPTFRNECFWPICSLVILGVAIQVGAGINRGTEQQEADDLAALVRRELQFFLTRLEKSGTAYAAQTSGAP